MLNIKLLDCTLRDGGYITNWRFPDNQIKTIISKLTEANIDYVECGYLSNEEKQPNRSIFQTVEQISEFLPEKRKRSLYLAMADVNQFDAKNLSDFNGKSIDGIRVVFYKHQVTEALNLCERVIKSGYNLFVQPMVTIDYTENEFVRIVEKISKLNSYAVAIVDSFGYMNKNDIKRYFDILDSSLSAQTAIGVHSHNNMQLAVMNAQSLFDYNTNREIIIDSSLYGMGRGAGNLNTELITNFYNMVKGYKFNINNIIDLISDIIYPIYKNTPWGYSPYFYLTAMYHCHPNYASYLLQSHDVSVNEFREFLELIPNDMRTKCKKEYVESLYSEFLRKASEGDANAK